MDEFFGTLFGSTPVSQQLGYLQAALLENIWETLYSTALATFFSYVIGLPLGIILVAGEKNGIRPLPRPLMSVLNFVINILRSVPFLILMIVVMPLSRLILGTSIGTEATIIPLTIAAFPFVARLVEGSLRETDAGVIEAAHAMGCTPFQIVRKVMLPEALPSLVTGFTTAAITILSYGAMSAAIGGGGRGSLSIVNGYQRRMYLILYVTVILLVILVQIIQSVGTWAANRLDHRGGKSRKTRLRVRFNDPIHLEIGPDEQDGDGEKHRSEKGGFQ